MGEKQGGRYGALIKQAKQSLPDNQLSGQPENQKASLPAPDEKRVNLCVRVSDSWRKHWAIQAKIQDITMTDVMVEALTKRFG